MALVASNIANTRTEDLILPMQGSNKENEGPTNKAGKRSPKNGAVKGSKSTTPVTEENVSPSAVTAADKKAPVKDNAVTAQLTKTKMCAFFSRGRCASTNCRYAHSPDELRILPNLQKTKLCRAFLQGHCSDENCPFAHGEEDLRVTEGIYKTQICNFFERGYCKKGDRCNHAHGHEDLRPCTPSTKSSSVSADGFNMDSNMSEEKKPQEEENVILQLPPPQKKSTRSPLPLAELLLDDNNEYVHAAPTPTKPGSQGLQQSLTPMGVQGVGQTPDWHLASGLPSFGQMHPISPVGSYPLSPTGAMYPASPLGMPTPSPSPIDMLSMYAPREPLDVLLPQQSQVNPQSAAPGMGLAYDPVLLGAPSGMNDLLAAQQFRSEANQSLLQQHQLMPLETRLASLDACVRDLAADVRNLQAPAASSRTNSAPAPMQLFQDTTNTLKEPDNAQAAQSKSFRI
eukprot:gnl/MRDRNA2_/MRDRNA2_98195_c0_seq1.p1 gnl/MRDRNA2_/MRDRNA2_98195_c0~~gnl/MRDRNA2_/MRDRNA2_98195_c0_seq1.p1  ORF type:complete len:456 (-),score=87.35 gnl/MRDRNA2_/MRDRNA2_98195_c0_seq1:587-1954(-)